MNWDMYSKENTDQNLIYLRVLIFFTSTYRGLQYTQKFVCWISTSITPACLYVLHWIVNCAIQVEYRFIQRTSRHCAHCLSQSFQGYQQNRRKKSILSIKAACQPRSTISDSFDFFSGLCWGWQIFGSDSDRDLRFS